MDTHTLNFFVVDQGISAFFMKNEVLSLSRISFPNEEMHFEIRILRTTLTTYTCSVFQYAVHRNGYA